MELLQGIKNIIFDLGGVLLNLDPQKTIDAFQQFGMSSPLHAKTLTYNNEVFYEMEQGFISPAEFRAKVNQLLPKAISDEEIDDAWTAMMLDFPESRIRILKNLRPHYRLFLFSNTNAIHVERFEENFRKEHGTDIQTFFDRVFYSNEIGYRKPDVSAFHEIIKLADIDPSESIFIDDLEANALGAKQAGLRTYWLKPEDQFDLVFADYLHP